MLHQHTACLNAWTNARAVANLLPPVGFLGRHDEYRNGDLQDPIGGSKLATARALVQAFKQAVC